MFTRIRSLALVALFATAVLAVACGGDSKDGGVLSGNSGSKLTFDTAKADALAHAAMLKPDELPGSGWTIDKDDDFSTDDVANVKACDTYRTFRDDAMKNAGKAKRDLTRPIRASDVTLDVGLSANVYESNDRVSALMTKYKSIVSGTSITDCFDAGLKDQLGARAGVSVKSVQPVGTTPSGGIPVAMDIDVTSEKLQLHGEIHTWTIGNAEFSVSVFGTRDAVTPDVVNGTIQKFDAAAKDAAAGKRTASPPSAAATTTKPTAVPTKAASPSATSTSSGNKQNTTARPASMSTLNSYRYTVHMEISGSGGPFSDLATQMRDLSTQFRELANPSAPTPSATAPVVMDISGAISRPDKSTDTYKVDSATIGLTKIGNQQWTQVGSNVIGPRTATSSSNAASVGETITTPLAGAFWDDLSCTSTTETVNGTSSKKCALDLTSLLKLVPDGELEGVKYKDFSRFSVSAWLSATGNYPVKFVFDIAGKDAKRADFGLKIEFNATDLNKTVDITPPKP